MLTSETCEVQHCRCCSSEKDERAPAPQCANDAVVLLQRGDEFMSICRDCFDLGIFAEDLSLDGWVLVEEVPE